MKDGENSRCNSHIRAGGRQAYTFKLGQEGILQHFSHRVFNAVYRSLGPLCKWIRNS